MDPEFMAQCINRGINIIFNYESDFSDYTDLDSPTDKNQQLRTWLKARRMSKDLEFIAADQTMMKDIVTAFGGISKVSTCLVESADDEQLQRLANLIANNKSQLVNARDHFGNMPDAMVSFIISFLSKKTICRFKQTCNRIAILCLIEMTKFNIRVCNMHELPVVQSTQDPNEHPFKEMSFVCKRYTQSRLRSFRCVREEWETTYGIPIKRQLCCRSVILYETCISGGRSRPFIKAVENYRSTNRFILFDKKHVLLLNDENGKRIRTQDWGDIDEHYLRDHTLVLLKYFDAENQTIRFITYMLITPDTDDDHVCQYLEKEWLPKQNQEWCKRLLQYLQEEGDVYCKLVIGYSTDHQWTCIIPDPDMYFAKQQETEPEKVFDFEDYCAEYARRRRTVNKTQNNDLTNAKLKIYVAGWGVVNANSTQKQIKQKLPSQPITLNVTPSDTITTILSHQKLAKYTCGSLTTYTFQYKNKKSKLKKIPSKIRKFYKPYKELNLKSQSTERYLLVLYKKNNK